MLNDHAPNDHVPTGHVPTDRAVTFRPADPPRSGTLLTWDPPGATDAAEHVELVVPPGTLAGVAVRPLPVADAVAALTLVPADGTADPAAAFWGAATRLALRLIARGRILPGLSATGIDAWRIGPLTTDDHTEIHALAAAMPPRARALPLPGTANRLPDARTLLRGYLDAVADTFVRAPGSATAFGQDTYAATVSQRRPDLREWAELVADATDAGIGLSLRLELELDSGRHRAVVQVHGSTDPTLVVDAGRLWAEPVPGFDDRDRTDTLRAVRRAAAAWPALRPLLDVAVPDAVELDDADLAELLGDATEQLDALGVALHWPREVVRGLTSRAVLGSGTSGPAVTFGGLGALDFRWRLALGEDELTAEEMDRLAEANRPYVRLRDQWVMLAPEQAARAKDRVLKPLSSVDALGAALTGSAELGGTRVPVTADGWLKDLLGRITEPDPADEPPAPSGLHAQLRDYQLRGFRWLARMTGLGLGACLADDMGLGKTVTLISLYLHRAPAATGPTLVVCPASLLGNWEREIHRFAPGTPVHRFHGTARDLAEARDGIVLTTYGTMRLDAARLAEVDWDLIVADEAQHVKNPASRTATALRRIPAPARVALTGTPVENNLTELWAILDWTTPGLLGGLTAFRDRFATPIEADGDTAAADRLARLTKPFLLRRKKTDPGIAPELPPKTETDQFVGLSAEQAGLYEAVVRETMAEIRSSSGMARRGNVVKLLTSLKQICNHPAQFLKETDAGSGRSGKLELLDELLDTITAENGAVLVFTQYVTMARLLERHLAARGVNSALLYGGTPVHRREDMVARFQAGEVPVFLLSLKAAGTGLNLTRADHVVHYDRWWNPAVEDQATDRAYRIGQTRPVQVHRMIVEGTVEDRIAEMLRRKKKLADAVLTGGEAALTELSDDDLSELVELRGAK